MGFSVHAPRGDVGQPPRSEPNAGHSRLARHFDPSSTSKLDDGHRIGAEGDLARFVCAREPRWVEAGFEADALEELGRRVRTAVDLDDEGRLTLRYEKQHAIR